MRQPDSNSDTTGRRRLRRRFGQSISAKLCLLFAVLLLAALANILVARALLVNLSGVAETVNVAGRLRMLSQRLAYQSTVALQAGAPPAGARAPDNDLNQERTVADYEAALNALDRGGAAFGYALAPPSAVSTPYLAALRAEWRRYRAQAGSAQTADVIARHQHMQLALAEALVGSLTGQAQEAQRDALALMIALAAVDAVVLAAAFLWLRRRVVTPLRALTRYTRAFARGEYQTRVAVASRDEIGELALAFNHSAQHIGHLLSDLETDRASMRLAEQTFRGLAENSVVGVYIVRQQRFHFVNPKMAEMFGYDRQHMMDSASVFDIVVEQEREFVEHNIARRISGEVNAVHYERRAQRRDGSTFNAEVYGSSMLIDGQPSTIGIILDITQRKRVERALRLQNACNEVLIRATDEASLLTRICQIVRQVGGHSCVRVSFSEPGRAPTQAGARAPGMDDVSGVLSLPLRAPSGAGAGAGSSACIGTLMVCAVPDEPFSGDDVIILTRLADNLAYGVAALRAEVERARYQQQLEYSANYDALTGLANRNLLSERLRSAGAHAARNGTMVGVLLHDLDNFKIINDSLGHEAGDALLVAVARRMRAAVREHDTVARLGGDEFVIVLPNVASSEEVAAVGRKLLAELARPFTIAHQKVYISASIGICMAPADGEAEPALLRNVDLAMYRAKRDGRNTMRFFTEELNAHNRERQELESALHHALEHGEFMLHYQPKIDYASGAITGVEALVRWNHPTLGVLQPDSFIALAEETGLIERLGAWVLRTACCQMRALHDSEGVDPNLIVAVNLSARQLDPAQLLRTVSAALADSGLAPACLELELTETAVMADCASAIGILNELKALGVRLSLDDFGTGYSSLEHLRHLPFDSIKIDRSFIVGVGQQGNDRAIVKTIIALASNLNMSVIAEGVEQREQAEFLHAHACHEMQGFLFARALAVPQLADMLARAPWARVDETVTA